jgi:hypothetical protein
MAEPPPLPPGVAHACRVPTPGNAFEGLGKVPRGTQKCVRYAGSRLRSKKDEYNATLATTTFATTTGKAWMINP